VSTFYRRPEGFRFRCSYRMSAYFTHVRTGREYRYDRPNPGVLMSYDVPAPDDVQLEWRDYRRADLAAFERWIDDKGYHSPSTDDIIRTHYPDVLAERVPAQ
jgi:hypothetical protein